MGMRVINDLCLEFRKLLNMAVRIVPILLDVIGTMPKSREGNLEIRVRVESVGRKRILDQR